MYKPLKEKYETEIYSETAEHHLKIFVDGVEIDGKYVKGVEFDDEVFNEEQFSLGNACVGQITLTVYNEAIENLETCKEFYFEYELVLDEEETQVVPIGYFYSHEDDIDRTDNSSVKFVLKDNMYDLENDTIDFSGRVDKGDFTRGDLVDLICETYGLTLMTPDFIGKDILVNTYDNTLKVTSWLKFISERAGGFAKIGRNKDLYIKSFKSVDKVEVPTKSMGTFKNGDLKTITGVCYKNATQNFTAGDETGTMIYLSQDNYFACSQEEVDAIYEELVGLSFQTLEVTIWGDPAIDTGDLISVGGITTFAQKHWSYGNGFYGNYKCVLNIVESVSGASKITQSDKVRRVQSIVDEANNKVLLQAQDIEENSSKIGALEVEAGQIKETVKETNQKLEDVKENSYTQEQINQLIISAIEGISNTFTLSGGNNLFFNTAPYRITSEHSLESWEGDVYFKEELDSITKLALLIRSGEVKQEVDITPGIYAIGFKYKLLNELATCKVNYNGKTIKIDKNGPTNIDEDGHVIDNEFTYNESTREITSYGNVDINTFTISFECDVEDGIEIYELRLVHGTAALPWTQNQNELKSKTVTIGDGITIDSEQANTSNNIDTNGMIVTNKTTGKVSLKATDEGIETGTLKASGDSNINSMLVQKIGEQVFITSIID